MPDQNATPAGLPDSPDRSGRENGDRPRDDGRDPVEQDPAVRRAFADDDTTTALTTEEQDDRGPLAPDFREPEEPSGREPGGTPREDPPGPD
ncbi:hypothetical protein [Streptomyces atacamensis]|uniref:hypothetical protein n=1 Tax=Streptomyces atacamensis TaxID=531966 RepID=UPI00399CEF9F